MSRFKSYDQTTATGKAKELLAAVKNKLGRDLGMANIMANSPAVLEGFLNFHHALEGSNLSSQLRQQIALLTAQENRCDYCLSAHSAVGKMVGLTHDQIVASRKGLGENPKTTAALTFAKRVLESRGQVSDAEVEAVRAAGFSDGEIAEIIAHVALNIFTNYFNIVTAVDIDFPEVSYAEIV